MSRTRILTHRGLDPDRTPFHTESSLQAFEDQLARGYGLEFDVQFAKDGQMIVIHEKSLDRLTNGADKRLISQVSGAEILEMRFNGDQLTTLPKLLGLISTKQKTGCLSALHLKSSAQNPEQLKAILGALEKTDPEKLLLFDLTVASARYIRQIATRKRWQLAASVAHEYDVERFNQAVGGTLITIAELLKNKDLFDWTWLDEWDLTDRNGQKKSLYNSANFEKLRSQKFKIALVTPELHGTSPGLLGGEAHPDARDRETLNIRLAQILSMKPDAICTDHPDYVAKLIESQN